MNCENINNKLLDYLDNNINPSVKEQIENHIAQCSKCSAQLEQFKKLDKLFENKKELEASEEFKNDFTEMLEHEKLKITKQHFRFSSIKSSLKIAASILIFISGSIFGILVQNYSLNKSKISKLEFEVNNLKQQVIFETLKEQTASEKIMAINYAYDKQNLEIDFANLLINHLNTDDNINVRMAALDALSNFTDDNFIYENLLSSLKMQDDPRLQIGLINLISTIKNDNSKEVIIEFLKQDDINPEVKLYAKELALINL